MMRKVTVVLLLHDELHLQETGAAVLEVGALCIPIGSTYDAVFPDVSWNAEVLVQTGITGFDARDGGGIGRIGLEERLIIRTQSAGMAPVKVGRERSTVGIRELVHPVE